MVGEGNKENTQMVFFTQTAQYEVLSDKVHSLHSDQWSMGQYQQYFQQKKNERFRSTYPIYRGRIQRNHHRTSRPPNTSRLSAHNEHLRTSSNKPIDRRSTSRNCETHAAKVNVAFDSSRGAAAVRADRDGPRKPPSS